MIEGGMIEFTSAKILDSFTYLLQLSYNRTKFTKLTEFGIKGNEILRER